MEHIESLVIIGSGPAGLSAAIYASRANLTPLVLEGPQPGGQLMGTTDVENFPGFAKPVLGPELIKELRDQAARFGTRFKPCTVTSVDLHARPIEISTDMGLIRAQSLVIATGAQALWLGLESEKRLLGRGVSACATCDGFFFKDQDVVVVGGGDTALEEACFLTKFAKSVTVVHRRDTLRASAAMQQRARANPKIRFIWNSVVEEILGEHEVRGIRLRNIRTELSEELSCQGVFVAIGHKPNTELFTSSLSLDEKGYILTKGNSVLTAIPGVFACGDVMDSNYRQAITAAGTGCAAALEAERYLTHLREKLAAHNKDNSERSECM